MITNSYYGKEGEGTLKELFDCRYGNEADYIKANVKQDKYP